MARPKRLFAFTFAALVLLALGAFLHDFWNRPPRDPSDPDDRPPIIVSGGSVDIGVDPKADEKGEMKKDLLGFTWYHDHYNTGPDHFDLVFDNATCTGSATLPSPVSTKQLTITYTTAGSTAALTFAISISFHNLTIDHASQFIRVPREPNGKKPKNHYQLTMPTGTLQSASFTSLQGTEYTCPLSDPKAAITIAQVRQ